MKTAKVIEDHAPVHEAVMVGRAGELLRAERADDEWPGWIWCVNDSGVGSWVPEPYLERDGELVQLVVDYDATELTVAAGDRLTLELEVNGWWWVRDDVGKQGWVPAQKMALD